MKAKEMEFQNTAEWRKWLKENHSKEHVVWIIFRKGKAKNLEFSYNDALEEALCYGWIDSIIKKIDDEKYLRKFTQRTNVNKWSTTNITTAKKLIANGRMAKAGRMKISDKILNQKSAKKPPPEFDEEIEKTIKGNKKAWNNFLSLAPSYQKRYVGWIQSAKKQDTRLKRANEAIELLEKGLKLEGK